MSREEQFMNFPKPHIINLLCDITDMYDEAQSEIKDIKAEMRTLYLNSRSNYISPDEKEKVKRIVLKYGLKA
jgi:hypothetical protein